MTLSRRQFIASTAAAAAAPAIVPASVFGRNAPSNRLQIGCIGVRNMGGSHFKSLLGRGDVAIVGVCDVDDRIRGERVAAAKAKGHTPASLRDFRELLSRGGLDAVIIATPDHWHAAIGVAAIRAGVDAYIEKPFTLTIHEGRVIAREAKRYGRVVACGSQRRSSNAIKRVVETVRNGGIGELRRVEVGVGHRPTKPAAIEPQPVPDHFDYDLWLGPAPHEPYQPNRCHYNFRFNRDYSGGELTNFGAHYLDVAQWGIGGDDAGPVAIEGRGEAFNGLHNTFHTLDITYRYADGVELRCTDGGQRCRFVGDRGWIDDRGRASSNDIRRFAPPPGGWRAPDTPGGSQLGNFLHCVRTRDTPAAPPEVGHRSASVCHLGNIAMTLARPLRWDPAAEAFVDDPAADRMRHRPYRAPWSL